MKAEMFCYKAWIDVVNPSELKNSLHNMLVESEFTVLNQCEHYFKPYGYTCVWILGESHLAIHTFPEEAKTYVELTSCTEEKMINFKEKFKIEYL